ncbi:34847_t:CDS:2, partial [Racocetra persica]
QRNLQQIVNKKLPAKTPASNSSTLKLDYTIIVTVMSTIRERFFNVNKAFELSTEDFNKQWALPKESSGRKENIPPEKLHMTWKRPAIDCKARIRIT